MCRLRFDSRGAGNSCVVIELHSFLGLPPPPCCLLFVFFHLSFPIIIGGQQRKTRRAEISFGIFYWHPSLKPLRFFKPLQAITARITKYKPLNLKAQLFRALCKLQTKLTNFVH